MVESEFDKEIKTPTGSANPSTSVPTTPRSYFDTMLDDVVRSLESLPGNHLTYTKLLVPRVDGATDNHGVDVLLLHTRAVYLLEVKDVCGLMMGGETLHEWTGARRAGGRTQFYNPIMQNRSHVRALSEYLGIPASYFRSFIVFDGDYQLSGVHPKNMEYQICTRDDLARQLEVSINARVDLLEDFEFQMIQAKLDKLAELSSGKDYEAHEHELGAVASGKLCPKCGKPLGQRRDAALDRTFVACSDYPTCDYTRARW